MMSSRELDANIDIYVMERIRKIAPYYSTNIAIAWSVVEKMATKGWRLKLEAKLLHRKEIRAYAATFERLVDDDLKGVGVWEIKTAPVAICLAALKAIGISELKGRCQTGHIVKPKCIACKNYNVGSLAVKSGDGMLPLASIESHGVQEQISSTTVAEDAS